MYGKAIIENLGRGTLAREKSVKKRRNVKEMS